MQNPLHVDRQSTSQTASQGSAPVPEQLLLQLEAQSDTHPASAGCAHWLVHPGSSRAAHCFATSSGVQSAAHAAFVWMLQLSMPVNVTFPHEGTIATARAMHGESMTPAKAATAASIAERDARRTVEPPGRVHLPFDARPVKERAVACAPIVFVCAPKRPRRSTAPRRPRASRASARAGSRR